VLWEILGGRAGRDVTRGLVIGLGRSDCGIALVDSPGPVHDRHLSSAGAATVHDRHLSCIGAAVSERLHLPPCEFIMFASERHRKGGLDGETEPGACIGKLFF